MSVSSRAYAKEPLLAAIAHHTLRDVEIKVATWRDELAALRSIAVVQFGRRLLNLEVPVGSSFGEVAEAQADVIIDLWCKQRENMVRMITDGLNPDTIVVAQAVGLAGQLGDMIRLHLHNALLDLDRELKETIQEAGRS